MHMCILASNNRTTDGSYANEKSLTSVLEYELCTLASIGTSSFLCYMIHTTTKVRLLATLSTRLVCILASCMDSASFVRARSIYYTTS